MHGCVWICMPICTYAETRIGHYISFSITLHLVALRKELSLSAKITISNRLSREQTSWTDLPLHHHPVLQEHASDCRHWGLKLRFCCLHGKHTSPVTHISRLLYLASHSLFSTQKSNNLSKLRIRKCFYFILDFYSPFISPTVKDTVLPISHNTMPWNLLSKLFQITGLTIISYHLRSAPALYLRVPALADLCTPFL